MPTAAAVACLVSTGILIAAFNFCFFVWFCGRWVEYGTIEPSAADAIKAVVQHGDDWLDLRGKHFVLLGATSAMGPLLTLLKHGATVVCVDLDRDFIWKKIFAAVRDSPGRIVFPVKEGTSAAEIQSMSEDDLAKISGSNLLADTPEIANWLETVCPGEQLTVGNYTYVTGHRTPPVPS